MLDGAIEAARLVDNIQAWPGTSSTAPSPRSPPATSSWRSPPQRRRSISRRSSTRASSGARGRRRWPPHCSSRPSERAAELLVASAGGQRARRHRGGWRARVRSSYSPVSACARPPRRSRARRAAARPAPRPWASRWRTRWPIVPPRPSHSTAASRGRHRAGAERCRGTRPSRTPSRPPPRGRSPAARSPRRASATGGGRAATRRRRARIAAASRRYRAAGRAGSCAARPSRPPAHAARQGGRVSRRRESLTEREHQIARLIVDRKTNPEIAASCSSARKPSRPTSATCCASSAWQTVSSWRAWSSRPIAPTVSRRRSARRPAPGACWSTADTRTNSFAAAAGADTPSGSAWWTTRSGLGCCSLRRSSSVGLSSTRRRDQGLPSRVHTMKPVSLVGRRRTDPGGTPTMRLNARAKAASER